MDDPVNLPHIPGGVTSVAVFTLLVGLWLLLGQGSTPGTGSLRLAGFVIVVGAILVLCEAMGLLSIAATPW